jgi:hypothetical protein
MLKTHTGKVVVEIKTMSFFGLLLLLRPAILPSIHPMLSL